MSEKKKRGKSTSKNKVRARPIKGQYLNPPNKIKLFGRFLNQSWIQLSLLFGFASFLFVIYPRISVEQGESLNPYKPFDTPFIIKNDGYLPLTNINYSINVDNVEDIHHNKKIRGVKLRISDKIPKLRANESSTIFINKYISTPENAVYYAEIYFNTTYKSFLVPYTFTENIRFKAERKKNGEYVWFKHYSKK
jgi:hypothetical protein